jgi:hypothetical protein
VTTAQEFIFIILTSSVHILLCRRFGGPSFAEALLLTLKQELLIEYKQKPARESFSASQEDRLQDDPLDTEENAPEVQSSVRSARISGNQVISHIMFSLPT